MASKLCQVVTYYDKLPPIKSHNSLNTWSGDVIRKIKNMSPLPQCLWPGRVVTYIEELLPIKSRNTFITWSCDVNFLLFDL